MPQPSVLTENTEADGLTARDPLNRVFFDRSGRSRARSASAPAAQFYRGCAFNIGTERRTNTWKFVFLATDKSTVNERSPLELYVVLITFLPSARVNRALKWFLAKVSSRPPSLL